MKQRHALLVPLLILPLAIASCRIVEVSSMPRTITMTIASKNPAQYKLLQLKASGKFEEVKPEKAGTYQIRIPAMDGGYSEFLLVKYNKHIPEDYPVIKVVKGGKVLKELSINDMERLPQKNGQKLLTPE